LPAAFGGGPRPGKKKKASKKKRFFFGASFHFMQSLKMAPKGSAGGKNRWSAALPLGKAFAGLSKKLLNQAQSIDFFQ